MGDVWPLHGLSLRTGNITLRVMRESELPAVCEVLPDDVELDPTATTYAGLDGRANRTAVVAQGYWRAFGTWSPNDWALPLVVRQQSTVLGVQWLEGPGYRTHRVVDSASWLVPEARGRGVGTQMRSAILELAFSHLGATAAVSSAVVGNAASLGVSRALGYVPTHTSILEHSGEVLQHVRLERSAWVASGRGSPVEVAGVEPALPFFGLGEEQ